MIELLKNMIENISAFFNNIFDKIEKLEDNYEKNKKWKLYLYLNGQCIKCLKIDKDFAPMNKIYVVKIKNMKHLVGTNKSVQMVVRSYRYKYTDEKKKQAHIEVLNYEGVELSE